MITLGLILLVLNALLLHVPLLYTLGIILVVAGVVLNFTPLLGGSPRRIY